MPLLTIQGETKSLTEWAQMVGISVNGFSSRIARGWTEEALLSPPRDERFREKHGMSRSHPLYRTWTGMRTRCYNPNHNSFNDYGGRGVSVCEEWNRSYMSFYHWSINNGYAPSLSIDRIDTNGDYSPSNCRWVDSLTQTRNRRSNISMEIAGETKTLGEWADIYGIKRATVYKRYREGLRGEDVIRQPEDRSRMITIGGITKSASEWSRESGISRQTIMRRIERGWSTEKLLEPLHIEGNS